MTIRQLKDILDNIEDGQLDDDVAIYVVDEDEYYGKGCITVYSETETDVLGKGHLVIRLDK